MATTSYSSVKTTIPKQANVQLRERLFERLDHFRELAATWISSPAGSGKTTLVASYIEARDIPCLWYQVDAGDADIASFFYLLAQAVKPEKSLPLLTPEYSFGIKVFSRRFFAELLAGLSIPFALVFDDYQEVDKEANIHEVIREVIFTVPAGIHVFILSRQDPPPLFAKVRVRGHMNMLGWEDLRLAPEEVNDLVGTVAHQEYPETVINKLYRKSDGWITGMILLLNHAFDEDVEPQLLYKFTPEEIFDYFASELFNTIENDLRQFLLQVAVLPVISVDLARGLTGNQKADQFLFRLNHRNYFTTRRLGRPTTYQFHPLFREFLLYRARQVFKPQELTDLILTAAQLIVEDGQLETAVPLYIKTRVFSEAVNIIIHLAPAMLAQGRHETLKNWLTKVPYSFHRKNPWLLFWSGASRLPYNQAESRDLFEKALQRFEEVQEQTGIILSITGICDSIAFEFNSYTLYDEIILKMLRITTDSPLFRSKETEVRWVTSIIRALSMRQPNHDELPAWRKRAEVLLDSTVNLELKTQLLIALIVNRTFSGDLYKAGFYLNIYKRLSSSPGISPLALVTLKNMEVIYELLSANFKKCQRATIRGLELADTTGVYSLNIMLLCNGTSGALANNNTKLANEFLEQLDPLLISKGSWQNEYFHVLLTWKAILEKDYNTAKMHAHRSLTLTDISGVPQTTAITYLGNALVAFYTNEKDEADQYLAISLDYAEKFFAPQVEFCCHLTKAEFCLAANNQHQLIASLQQAMALGSKHKYMTTWFWRAQPVASLCALALELAIEPNYVQQLITTHNLTPETPPIHLEFWPWPVKIYTFGRFELLLDGKKFIPKGKSPGKSLNLLKAIIALGGRKVSSSRLSDILWPDSDGDMQYQALKTAIHRLRRLLGIKEIILFRDNMITLNPLYCWVDTWAFERLLSIGNSIERQNKDFTSSIKVLCKACSLYQGEFLHGDNNSWVIPLQQKLRQKFLATTLSIGRNLVNKAHLKEAVVWYEKGLAVEPLQEKFYRELIQIYLAQDLQAEAMSVFKRCEKILTTVGADPSRNIEQMRSLLVEYERKLP